MLSADLARLRAAEQDERELDLRAQDLEHVSGPLFAPNREAP